MSNIKNLTIFGLQLIRVFFFFFFLIEVTVKTKIIENLKL